MFKQTLAPGRLPPGVRVYAVGDVHGCADALVALHAAIGRDLAARPVAAATLVHLGDYIDRGPDSARVIAMLSGAPPIAGAASVTLRGNHEQMLLDAVLFDDPDAVEHWIGNGGAASLQSWGIPADAPPGSWHDLLPAAHLAFLEALPSRHQAGDYLFVHAGVQPGVPLDAQTDADLIWIREPFLSSTADFGAVVVHGHTPRPTPVVRPNRIGIDTGAVLGGKLTCAVLETDQLGFIHV